MIRYNGVDGVIVVIMMQKQKMSLKLNKSMPINESNAVFNGFKMKTID